jgi:hypothetical protein
MNEETVMPNKIIPVVVVAALAVLLAPSEARAYGAAHVGYTHVGPNGVYHTGETAVAGPGGVAATGRTTAAGYGGTEYRSGAAYGVDRGGAYGAAGDYRYAPSYGGTAVGGEVRYGYIR